LAAAAVDKADEAGEDGADDGDRPSAEPGAKSVGQIAEIALWEIAQRWHDANSLRRSRR
jgi:hypothetical protein